MHYEGLDHYESILLYRLLFSDSCLFSVLTSSALPTLLCHDASREWGPRCAVGECTAPSKPSCSSEGGCPERLQLFYLWPMVGKLWLLHTPDVVGHRACDPLHRSQVNPQRLSVDCHYLFHALSTGMRILLSCWIQVTSDFIVSVFWLAAVSPHC